MHTLTLKPTPPFRLDYTASLLRRLRVNEMDRWDGHTYTRVLVVQDKPVEIAVTQTTPPDHPELQVRSVRSVPSVQDIHASLTKMLGLNIDLADFYHLAASDPKLHEPASRSIGFKPPRFESIFEALVNGIACQQLSPTVGIQLLNRLCARYGLATNGHHAFPRPEDLVTASPEDLRKLGFSARKAEYILSASRAILSGELDPESLEKLDDDSLLARLCELRGIGRWTAQYVALRGLGRLNIYPADDVGSQSKLQKWLKLEKRPDYEAVHQITDKWSPYRGLIYFLLFLDRLIQNESSNRASAH